MQAIEFEAIAHQHTIHIPDTVPDGVLLRVLLLLDENTHSPPKPSEKTIDSTEGLTDEDLFRPWTDRVMALAGILGDDFPNDISDADLGEDSPREALE